MKTIRLLSLLLLTAVSMTTRADDDGASGNCPSDIAASVEAEFGSGDGAAAAATRCLENLGGRRKVRVVYQVNQECKGYDAAGNCTAAYAVGNIINALNDYKMQGMTNGRNFEIVAIVHGSGWKLILNDSRNKYPGTAAGSSAGVADLLAQGVKVYFCQNTARSKGVVFSDLVPGVEFVTSGVTALADFQIEGYALVQP